MVYFSSLNKKCMCVRAHTSVYVYVFVLFYYVGVIILELPCFLVLHLFSFGSL